MSRLLGFLYFLEAGLLLVVVPWSVFWERNFFLEHMALLGSVLRNHFVRGAITGIGIVCLGAAVTELLALWRGRPPETLAQVSSAPASLDLEQ